MCIRDRRETDIQRNLRGRAREDNYVPSPALNCKKISPLPLPTQSFPSPTPQPHHHHFPHPPLSRALMAVCQLSATSVLTDTGKHWLPCFGLSVTTPTSVSLRYGLLTTEPCFLHSFCCGQWLLRPLVSSLFYVRRMPHFTHFIC